jgi:hypothetical protein
VTQVCGSEILLHKADQPDFIVNFLDADGLSGKDLAEVNFLVHETDASATSDHDGSYPASEAGLVLFWSTL